jgi:hypothetical protein
MSRRAGGVTPAAITSGNQTGHARLTGDVSLLEAGRFGAG